MEWLSLLLAAVLFAAACNLDTVILSMGYAVKGCLLYTSGKFSNFAQRNESDIAELTSRSQTLRGLQPLAELHRLSVGAQ